MNADKAVEQFAELKKKTLDAKRQELAILRAQEDERKLKAALLDIKRQTAKLESAEASLARTMETATAPVPAAVVPAPPRPAQTKNDEKGSSSPADDEKEV